MTDKEILKEIRQYFEIHELVGREVFNIYGFDAWKFLDIRLLHAILIIRKGIKKKITVNNWFFGGKLSQRGLRSNLQQIFRSFFIRKRLYLSGHVLGKAIDFDVEGMDANEVRRWIKSNKDMFPFKIRLERKSKGEFITWVHLDVIQEEKNPQVYMFDV